MKKIVQLTCCLALTCCLVAAEDNLNTINRLRKALLRDARPKYSPRARPVKKWSTATNVSVTFYIERIDNWDLRTGTLSMEGEMILTWHDEHLNWNPDAFDGLKQTFFATYDIWIPEISLWSSSDTQYINRFVDFTTPVLVNSSGHCEWWPLIKMTTHCTARLNDFPFDENSCVIKIGPNAHTANEIQLDVKDHFFEAGLIDQESNGFYGPSIDNTEYHVSEKQVSTRTILEKDGTMWSVIWLTLTIKRRSTLYALYVGLPYITASLVHVVMFIFTHPKSLVRTILSSVSLVLFLLAALLISVAIGSGALHSNDAPYAIKCTGVNIFIVSLNLLLSRFFVISTPDILKRSRLVDRLSILWTNRYVYMIFCSICVHSIDPHESAAGSPPNRITVVSDRMRITDEDNVSNDESTDQEASSHVHAHEKSSTEAESPLLVILDRMQLIIYIVILIFYHS